VDASQRALSALQELLPTKDGFGGMEEWQEAWYCEPQLHHYPHMPHPWYGVG